MLFTNDESSSKHSSRIDHGTWALSWDSSWWCLKTNVSVPNSNRVSTVSLYHLDLSSAIQVDHPRWFLPKYDGSFTPKIHRCHGTIRGNYGQFGPSKLICPGVTWFFQSTSPLVLPVSGDDLNLACGAWWYLAIAMALSENTIYRNPLVNHRFPYQHCH